MHPTEKRPTAEVVMTVLHAGGKFNHSNYKVSGGLHGVGVSVVNALSDGSSWRSSARARSSTRSTGAAIPATGLDAIGVTDKTGTKVTFKPDPEIFKGTEFSFEMLSQRLRELAYLNQGLTINLEDERTGKTHEFHFEGGIAQFVGRPVNAPSRSVHDKPVTHRGRGGRHPGRDRAAVERLATRRRSSASPTTSRTRTAAPTSPASARR